MRQIARNVTMDEWGCLDECRYLLHDRDTKYTHSFRQIIKSGGVEPLRLPPRSPNLNAHAERWVKSIKDECLSKLIFFGEASLRHALRNYLCTIMARGIIKARAMCCCSPQSRREGTPGRVQSNVENA